jgi:uncharacterized repeat protein (TIGR02543 family)
MKYLLSLLPCLLALQGLAQSQTASVTAYCRSLCLYGVTAYSGAYNFEFTTMDDSTGLPQYIPVPGGQPIFSNELRPTSGQSKLYEADYETMSGITPVQYGALTLTLSAADTNHNDIPDILDPAVPMYCVVPGTGYASWPASNYFTLSLRFNRAAGSPTGTFSGNWTIGGGSYSIVGSMRLMLLQGSATYTRGHTNQLRFQLTRTNPDGVTTNTLTGSTTYNATAGQISLPRFTLTDGQNRTYTAQHTVLYRHGHVYQGDLRFVDGAPETPWVDYRDWILSITDPTDSDGDGVPDISDPDAVHVPSAPITITTNGQGTVTPALSGQNLELGKTYRLTAKPAAGYLFDGWTGDMLSSSRVLSFTMRTNLALQANFVPNPFYPLRGTYYGLIMEDTNAPSNQTLGSFTATTTEGGTYSAKFQLGGRTFALSGAFDASGSSYPVIVSPNLRTLFVELHLDLTNGSGFSGTLGDGTWTAAISANKSFFKAKSNPCAFAGKYTFANPSSGAYGALPLGHNYGTVNVDAAGHVRCAAWLADGTRVTQSTMLSSTGDWPFYVSLYGGKGCLAGWLTFTNLNGLPDLPWLPLSGVPVWVKPAATTKYAPEGFTNRVSMLLTAYSAPRSGMPLLDWTNGIISFREGNLEEPFAEDLSMGSHNKLASASTNKLSLRVSANGLFQGRVTPPGSTRPVAFRGAVLQQMGSGFGHWLGTNESGAVQFGPMPLVPGAPGSPTNFPLPGVPQFPPATNITVTNIIVRPPLPPFPTNILILPLTNPLPVLVTNILTPIQVDTNFLVWSMTNTSGSTSSSGVVIQRTSSAGAATLSFPSSGASIQTVTRPLPWR